MTDFLNKKRKKENEEQEKDNSESFHLKKAKKDEIQLEPEKINSQIESSIKNPQNKDIEDLIFKYNIKSGIFKCSICQKEITNNIKFYCEECDYIFCINCFLLSKHNNNHGYHLIDALNFPFL